MDRLPEWLYKLVQKKEDEIIENTKMGRCDGCHKDFLSKKMIRLGYFLVCSNCFVGCHDTLDAWLRRKEF